MRPLALVFLLAFPLRAATIRTVPGKAGFGPVPAGWSQSIGYLLAQQPSLSAAMKLDAGSLKAGDPKALKALEPLVWAIQGLGHQDPLEFLRLAPELQAEAVSQASSAADKEVSLQALALLQAKPQGEAALRETAQAMARLRFAYGSRLPAELMAQLASAHDAARAELSRLTSEKAASAVEAAAAYWLSQSPSEDALAQDGSLPEALARRLANLLDVVPPGTREFNDALKEMSRVSSHFTDPKARRIIVDALLSKVREGAKFSASASVTALKDLAVAMKDEPAPLQDAALQEKIVRELSAAEYASLDIRLGAMRAVWALGMGSPSRDVRRLAHDALEKHANIKAALDEPYYAETLAAMSAEVAKGLSEPKKTPPVLLQKLTLPVGPVGNN